MKISTEEFVLFCSIDSKAKGWKNGDLRKRKKLTGLPSLAFLDEAGTVLVKINGRLTGWRQFEFYGRKARRYVALRAASRQGDKPAKAQFLLMQFHERQLTLAQALAIRDEIADVIPADSRVHKAILHLRIAEEIRAKGQKGRHELGPRFYRMLTEDPKPGHDVGRGFWYAILEWAERENKRDEFAVALDGMRRSLAFTDPQAAWVPNLLARYEKKLEKLTSGSRRK